jgi:hypothetical protein
MKMEEGQNKDEIRRRCQRNRKTRERRKKKQEQQKENLTKKKVKIFKANTKCGEKKVA